MAPRPTKKSPGSTTPQPPPRPDLPVQARHPPPPGLPATAPRPTAVVGRVAELMGGKVLPSLTCRGALASGQALGAIDSYPVGQADPGALCTACERREGGIQLRGSGRRPQRLHDHAPTPDVAGPSSRDGPPRVGG